MMQNGKNRLWPASPTYSDSDTPYDALHPWATSKIQFACMSLMWGRGHLGAHHLAAWLYEVSRAGYTGVSCFSDELTAFYHETPFPALLTKNKLALASVDVPFTRDATHIEGILDIMHRLQCKHLVAVGGMAAKRDADLQEIAVRLESLGRISIAYGVTVCYHHHTHHAVETLEETEALLAMTNPGLVGGFLDVGHATKDFSGHPVRNRANIFFSRHARRIKFLEFKDWSKTSDFKTEVGTGQTGWPALLQTIRNSHYHGWITVEQNAPTRSKTPFECAKASLDFLRRHWRG